MSRKQAKRAARAAEREALLGETRPFAGLAAETQLVALQEFVPSAYAVLPTPDCERTIYVCTVLPGAVSALVRDVEAGGQAFVALQTQRRSNRPGRSLAAAIAWARTAAPGSSLAAPSLEDAPALRDVFDADATLDVTVRDDLNWWVPEGHAVDARTERMVAMANERVMPSAQVNAHIAGSAWWVDAGDKAHIRWVRQEPEEKLLTALARLSAAGHLSLGEGTKFAGAFRTHGVNVPVFDVDPVVTPQEYAEPLTVLDTRLQEVLATEAQLSVEERKALSNIKSRLVTIR